MPAAGLALALGIACEPTVPRNAPGAVSGVSPSGAAPASTPSAVPELASSAQPAPGPIPLDDLSAVMAAKLRASRRPPLESRAMQKAEPR
jgi:hypothetical protein